MKEKTTNIILLKELLKKGIHVEDAIEFENSIFAKVYDNAKQSVEKIVQINRDYRNSQWIRRAHQEIEITNVISFVGRRGTGKTSTMLSFCKALDEYKYEDGSRYQNSSGLKFSEEANMKSIRFFSLDYIDASVLEESEDVFILVLANMLNYLEKVNNESRDEMGYEYRMLLQQFEHVYNDFLTIKKSKQYDNEEYSLYERLKNIASSQRIRIQFQNLVKKYLEFINMKVRSQCEELYLVIAIDDLDMAHYNVKTGKMQIANNKSYEIASSIYKYLSIPGIIVLAAYNHVNLIQQCIHFFMNSDIDAFHTDQDRINQRQISSKLANQFMDKVFSVIYRHYLPSWEKGDYTDERFRINIDKEMSRDFVLKKHGEEKQGIVTIKELILFLYAEGLGVYYDFEGKKTHFLEPNSLRSLSDMIAIFGGITVLKKDKLSEKERAQSKAVIFKKVKDDLYFRFIQEKLSLPEERNMFNDWMKLRIDRRSEEIVRLVSKDSNPLGKEYKKNSRQYKAELEVNEMLIGMVKDPTDKLRINREMIHVLDNSNVRYSFAELIHSLYHMTRSEQNIKRFSYSKELVACILHSYSIYLTEIYDAYREEMEKIEKDVYVKGYRNHDKEAVKLLKKLDYYREILKNVIGDTICGRWAEYFFPEVYTTIQSNRNINTKSVIIGYIRNADFVYSGVISNTEEEIKQWLKEVIFVCMLYKDVLNWNSLTLKLKPRNDNKIDIEIFKSSGGDVELTAFLKYTFLYPEFFLKMENLLSDAVDKEEKNNCSMQNVTKRMKPYIRDIFNDLWDNFFQKDKKNGSMMLPINNFDYTYNMIKHMFIETKEQNESVLISEGSDFLNEFDRMLKLFEKYLSRLDDFYCIKEEKKSFVYRFTQNPYFSLLNELKKRESFCKRIGILVKGIFIMEAHNKQTKSVGADEVEKSAVEGNID